MVFCCYMLEISRDIHVPILYLYSLCMVYFLFILYDSLFSRIDLLSIPVVLYSSRIACHYQYLPYHTVSLPVEPSVTARANNVPLPMPSSRGVGRSDWLAFLTAVSVSHAFIERRRQQSTILLLLLLLSFFLSSPIHLHLVVFTRLSNLDLVSARLIAKKDSSRLRNNQDNRQLPLFLYMMMELSLLPL